jgi:hypothetical protein
MGMNLLRSAVLLLFSQSVVAGPACEPPRCEDGQRVLVTDKSYGRVELACARGERRDGPYRVCTAEQLIEQGHYVRGRVMGAVESVDAGRVVARNYLYPRVGRTRCTLTERDEVCTVTPELLHASCRRDGHGAARVELYDDLAELAAAVGCSGVYASPPAPGLDIALFRVEPPAMGNAVDHRTTFELRRAHGDSAAVLHITHHPGCVVGGMEREDEPAGPVAYIWIAAVPGDVAEVRREVSGDLQCDIIQYAP